MLPLAAPTLRRAAIALLATAPFAAPAFAQSYAVDFVATAAGGTALDDAGDVAGTSYVDEGCGSFCLPAQDTVVWVDGERLVLPEHPDYSGIYVTGINADGWVSGYAGIPGTTTRSVAWRPVEGGYELVDLGTLAGMASSYTVGIDDAGRVVGWASTGGAIPTAAAPFVWTEADGMRDLTDDGYPSDIPMAVSPGGTVATYSYWYSLDDPASVEAMRAAPSGFYSGAYSTVVNDAGQQGRFLLTTSSSSLVYAFRYDPDVGWTQLSSVGSGSRTRYGMGSINADGDITGTISSAGFVAWGPSGLAEGLGAYLSPAYPGSTVDLGGPQNSGGDVLAQVMIGRSDRLVKLTPVDACVGSCLQVSSLVVRSRFVPDPADPGHCTEGGSAVNRSQATVTVTDATGAPQRFVTVQGRWLDDYWTDEVVTGRTNAAGVVTFNRVGLCGVGAVAFLVDDATRGPFVLDRTTGTLSGYAIPR